MAEKDPETRQLKRDQVAGSLIKVTEKHARVIKSRPLDRLRMRKEVNKFEVPFLID